MKKLLAVSFLAVALAGCGAAPLAAGPGLVRQGAVPAAAASASTKALHDAVYTALLKVYGDAIDQGMDFDMGPLTHGKAVGGVIPFTVIAFAGQGDAIGRAQFTGTFDTKTGKVVMNETNGAPKSKKA